MNTGAERGWAGAVAGQWLWCSGVHSTLFFSAISSTLEARNSSTHSSVASGHSVTGVDAKAETWGAKSASIASITLA